MSLSKATFVIIYLLLLPWSLANAQVYQTTESQQAIAIDSISIKRNWRTRDRIILEELEFKAGDKVSSHTIETSVGTAVRFMIPMVPFIYAQFSFTYSRPGSNWFDFVF